jgi:hypothetical protein
MLQIWKIPGTKAIEILKQVNREFDSPCGLSHHRQGKSGFEDLNQTEFQRPM